MAYNARRTSPHDAYVRFNSYTGTERPASSAYQNMQQQPDVKQQGISSVPMGMGMDMMNAPPPISDNRFANTPPPNMNPVPVQMPTRVIPFRSEELFELLHNPKHHYTREGKPTKVVVKVYTDWCGPCRTLAPKFDEMSIQPENSDILFVSIDGEKISSDLNQYIAVSAVPVIFTFYCGRKLNMIPGADVEKIRGAIQELAMYHK